MRGNDSRPWDQATDDGLVERLIVAFQRATLRTVAGTEQPDREVELPAPEMTTALLNLLASVLEEAPACGTPMGMRQIAEAAGKELLVLMRGVREMKRPPAGFS